MYPISGPLMEAPLYAAWPVLLCFNSEWQSFIKQEKKTFSKDPALITSLPPSVWQTMRDPLSVAQLGSTRSGPPCDVICLHLRGKRNTRASQIL